MWRNNFTDFLSSWRLIYKAYCEQLAGMSRNECHISLV
ncbi:hypothetical protein OCAR_7711 [Afipia carboxidovorans OM5]|nr:hypothetical protein OCAR_7711 [Afipia carboxidovorans OM5]